MNGARVDSVSPKSSWPIAWFIHDSSVTNAINVNILYIN